MPKELIFLQVSEARAKHNFLRHIHNLVHIEVNEKTTMQMLFDALEKLFDKRNDTEAVIAARSLLEFNLSEFEEAEQKEFLENKVLDLIPEEGITLYAIFDLIPLTA